VRRPRRPRQVVVSFRGVDYEMDLAVCERALVRRQVEGAFDSVEGLARAIGRSRSTASRFLAGRQTSLTVALATLDRLNLSFDEVYTPCHVDDLEQDRGHVSHPTRPSRPERQSPRAVDQVPVERGTRSPS
jgi:hypothetical protein